MKPLFTTALLTLHLRSTVLAANVRFAYPTTTRDSSAKMALATSTAGAAVASPLEQFELLAATNAANNTAAVAPRVWNALAGVLGLSSLGEVLGLITVFSLLLAAVALRAPALAVRSWSATIGELLVRGLKNFLASNATLPAFAARVRNAALFAYAADGTTSGDGGPPSGDPMLLLLAGVAVGAVLAVAWLLFGSHDKPRGDAPSPPPAPREVNPPPAEPSFPEPAEVGQAVPFQHNYTVPRPLIQLPWSPELLWKLTIFGGIVLGLMVISGFFGGPEGGDGGAGPTAEHGAGSGGDANRGDAGNDSGGPGRGGTPKKRLWKKPKRVPLPARYTTAAPTVTPTPAIPAPTAIPAPAGPASPPAVAPTPTVVEDDNSSLYDEEVPLSRSPSPPLSPSPPPVHPHTPPAIAPSPAAPAPAAAPAPVEPAPETPSPSGPQPASPLSDVEGPPPFDFDRFLREVSPTPYARLSDRQLRDLMAEEMRQGPREAQETAEDGSASPSEAKGGDPSSTDSSLRWRNWAER